MSRTALKLKLGALVLAVVSATAAQDQAVLNLDGDWAVRVRLPSGNEYDASLRLDGGSGLYRFSLRNTGDPCVGLPTPVLWRPTPEGIDISFQGSKALTGCLDTTVSFRRLDDNAWQGRSQRGIELTLRRRAPG